MTIKDSLSGNIIGHWDFRKGTADDQSSNSNDGSFTVPPSWQNGPRGKTLLFDGVNDYVDVGSHSSLNITTGDFSITAWARCRASAPGESASRIFSNRDSIGYELMITKGGAGGNLLFVIDEGDVTAAVSSGGANLIDNQWHFVAATADRDGNVTYFVDGVEDGTPVDISAITGTLSNSANALIGQFADNADTFFNGSIQEVTIYDTLLTQQQVSQLYNESLQEAHLDKIPTSTIMPNLMAVPEFDQDTIWTKGAGWTIAGGQASSDGSQAGVSDLSQAIGAVGNIYTIEYKVSGYSAGNVTGLAGNATGTARNANGVYFDTITATADTDLGLQADANFIGNIEYVKISLSTKLDLNFTGEDLEVTTANQTSGFLSNSIFTINSGTWSVVDTGTQKVLNCVANGQLQLFFTGADNLTTTTFETISGTPTITKNALNIQLNALAGEQIGIIRLSPT